MLIKSDDIVFSFEIELIGVSLGITLAKKFCFFSPIYVTYLLRAKKDSIYQLPNKLYSLHN